ncbi:Nitroreductase family protein [Amycolatopsis xylanica]|uniref:Nitroreductase family protein n=1 Tax=Amycolatopsis xylanica TaxID=589385 RepID=A0A1H2VZL5_9PSEU|nr:nitroreductase family protein [Amycolatopsis xylanica]SDW73790.1 Nitroreductase family protein [Amycolatopsis xylanica]
MATWSADEVEVLARAVTRAPSVHSTQPWELKLADRRAEIAERPEFALGHHDPDGRDRLISCGAALANLWLAVRALGWRARLETEAIPPWTGAVTALRREPPTAADLHLYSAIARRHSHRHAFASTRVAEDRLATVIATAGDGVRVRVVAEDELLAVAAILERAAKIIQGEAGFHAELAWREYAFVDREPGRAGAPWAGLVRVGSRIPDAVTLAARLENEVILVLCTENDRRADHVRTGLVMQRIWLSAVDNGLVASVLTQPLHVRETREDLAEKLALPVLPRLIMRLGHPAGPVRPRGDAPNAGQPIGVDHG